MATILCVDDQSSCLEVEVAILESKSYVVLTATDGLSGIVMARKHAIDALILDFNLEGMNGNQVAEFLRREHPALPVIIWSSSPDATSESLKWFADVVLHKEDGPGILLSTVEGLLADNARNNPVGCTPREAPIPGIGGFAPIRLVNPAS
jgi:DNA-binding response OmpR family regulator